MRAILLLARAELRGQLRSLVMLSLLVAMVAGVSLTALSGARRTATSYERFREESVASSIWVQVNDPEAAPRVVEAVADLPMVRKAAGWVIAPTLPEGLPDEASDFALMADPLGAWGETMDRPRVLDGRLPLEDAADEVLLTRTAAGFLDAGVGDQVSMLTFSPADLEALVTSDGFPGFNGPALDLTVVGVGLWPDDLQGRAQSAMNSGLVSPAFLAEHGSEVGAWPVSARVILRDENAGLAPITAAVREIAGPDVEVLVEEADEEVDAIQSAVDAVAVATFVFAALAGLAGLVVVAQASTRQLAVSRLAPSTLFAMGLTSSERCAALGLPVFAATTIGVACGALLSVLASPLLPVGIARDAEPDLGVWIDGGAIALGSLVLVVLIGAWIAVSARSSVLGKGVRRAHGSRLANWAARAGASPDRVAGVRFAFEQGAGRTRVPARAAIVGGVLGVAGLVAVAVIAASLSSLIDTPSRWGWTWSSRPDIEGEAAETLAVIEGDERIASVAALLSGAVEIDGEQLLGYAIDQTTGSTSFSVLSGRAPATPGEVALGRRTLDDLDLGIGDEVTFESSDRSSHPGFEIVGVVATPMVDSADPGRGATFTVDGLDSVRQSDGDRRLLLTYAPDVDVAALEAELTETADLYFPIYARPGPPAEVVNLNDVRGVAVALAAFFAVLGFAGVAHALVVSARRRRPDLGLLEVLGFVRPQVRRVLGWQASSIALASCALGIPAGLILGRFVWRLLLGNMGVSTDPAQPWPVLIVIVPATVVLARLVSLLPLRLVTRVRPAAALRAE